ncbi:hypothetical protein [Metabacillus litoralis]|uniref:hypothetical protein n=1 Tax=Metabacillus litoralis TaxID=152268 RepID=UPI001CFEF7EE|nr:hypothetical protein [Metabacillus litoralis]
MFKKIILLSCLTLILFLLIASYSTDEFMTNTSKKVSSVDTEADNSTHEESYLKIKKYKITKVVDEKVEGLSDDHTVISFRPTDLKKPFLNELSEGMEIKVYFSKGAGGLMIEKIETL